MLKPNFDLWNNGHWSEMHLNKSQQLCLNGGTRYVTLRLVWYIATVEKKSELPCKSWKRGSNKEEDVTCNGMCVSRIVKPCETYIFDRERDEYTSGFLSALSVEEANMSTLKIAQPSTTAIDRWHIPWGDMSELLLSHRSCHLYVCVHVWTWKKRYVSFCIMRQFGSHLRMSCTWSQAQVQVTPCKVGGIESHVFFNI